MNGNFFFYSVGLFVFVITVSILLKRALRIHYDRRTLIANVLSIVIATITWFVFAVDPLSELFEETGSTWQQKLMALLAIVFISNALIQFLFWFGYAIIRHRDWIKMPRFLFNIFSFIIIIGVLLISIKEIFNQELDGLLVTSTVVSAVIGLALQSTLTNLFSGFSLQIESPFNIDDWVNLGGHEGKVVSQNWRTVTLLSRENHRVSLTNAFVADDKIINYSRPTRRQIHNFYIELDYSHPPNKVKKVLRDVLNEIDEVDLDTNHGAFVVDYMGSGIKYCMRYWLYDYADVLLIQDIVLTRVWYALKRNGIKIPYPTTEVQMHMLEDPGGEVDTIDHNYVVKFLSKLDWLKGMQADNIEKLASNAKLKLYAKGDLMVQQGADGNSMFIIIDGLAKVNLRGEKNNNIEIAEKLPGEFFGEMSLLTGEPRTASINAGKDCHVLVIDKASFSSLIISDEKILAEFIETLVESKSGIAEAIEKESKNSHVTPASAYKIVIDKIWTYLKAK